MDSSSSIFDYLSYDITSLILSYLPLRSLLRCTSVSHMFRHAARSSLYHNREDHIHQPWFFLTGLNNVVSRLDQSFAFDPESFTWSLLPAPHPDSVSGAAGFCFAASSCGSFGYSGLLTGRWRFTKAMSYPRCNPIVTVFEGNRFVVVGGARYIGGLVDLEDRLTVEIYDPKNDSWEVGPPLPVDFRSGGGSSSQWLSAALLPARKTLFVFGIYSCQIAAFDLSKRVWKGVQTLRPYGALFGFLLAGPDDSLLLAGLEQADNSNPNPSFAIWSVNPESPNQSKQITKMPHNLLTNLFGSDEDENRFASLKCVGSDRLVYVFNVDHHKGYPTCVCNLDLVRVDRCKWDLLPSLPGKVNRFHKTVAFCSNVPFENVLDNRME